MGKANVIEKAIFCLRMKRGDIFLVWGEHVLFQILKFCGFHTANFSKNLSMTGSGRCLDTKLSRFCRIHRV